MNEKNNIPMEYQPISMWGYFGYEILFAIPCIGWILLLVFAFGGTRNINVRNFARSYFCLLIIVAVLFGIFMLLSGVYAANVQGKKQETISFLMMQQVKEDLKQLKFALLAIFIYACFMQVIFGTVVR